MKINDNKYINLIDHKNICKKLISGNLI